MCLCNIHVNTHTHLHLYLFLCIYNEKQEFILIPPILVQNYRVHSSFSPFMFVNLFSNSEKSDSYYLQQIYLFNFLNFLVYSQSPNLPGHCCIQMPSLYGLWPLCSYPGHPARITPGLPSHPLYHPPYVGPGCHWAAGRKVWLLNIGQVIQVLKPS